MVRSEHFSAFPRREDEIVLKLSLKIFERRASVAPGRTPGDSCWWRDPLTHPDLAAMDQRQLGDLPFNPARIVAGQDRRPA